MGAPALRQCLRAAALALALSATAASARAAEAWRIDAQCRNGLPNGAWFLRSEAGRLRASGALAYGKLTGTFIFWGERGARLAVLPFHDDALSGTVAAWYPSASGAGERGRRLETSFAEGLPHGLARSWWPDGSLRTEILFQHGRSVETRAYSARGDALDPPRAARLAAQDAASEGRERRRLETLIRSHLPRCGGALPSTGVDRRPGSGP